MFSSVKQKEAKSKTVLIRFYHSDKIPEKATEGRKDLLWLLISEGSVHGWLAP